MTMKNKLARTCLEFSVPVPAAAVVEQPYIPWVPEHWNGLLVLAEAQNLSKTNSGYVDWLRSLEPEKLVCRLYERGVPANLGIEPWDDGSLKLAVEASLGLRASETAVSNAVLWSQVSGTGANQTPSQRIIDLSIGLWSKLLPILRPSCILCAGNVAHRVMTRVEQQLEHALANTRHFKLRLPSKTAMSRMSGMFREDDLKLRYPEVAAVIEQHSEWVRSYGLNKIFYACHAVSVLAGHKETCGK